MRHIHALGTYFVTTRTWDSQALLCNERNALAVIETLMDYRAAGKYCLHAFVIMPDHIHVLMTLGMESSLERTVQLMKGGSSHRIGLLTPRRSPFWQRGFNDHRIRDANDFFVHVRYIDLNPVKRGLAQDAAEYRFSSAHVGFTLAPIPQRLKPEVRAAAVGTAKATP